MFKGCLSDKILYISAFLNENLSTDRNTGIVQKTGFLKIYRIVCRDGLKRIIFSEKNRDFMSLKNVFLKESLREQLLKTRYVSILDNARLCTDQSQTADAFSSKWSLYDYESEEFQAMVNHQKKWYLELYGFETETALAEYLSQCEFVLDAGAGTGYKAAWFAELSPATTVIAVDISSSLQVASQHYSHLENLYFIQGDIGDLGEINDNSFDYVSCDQVIHHTAVPFETLTELHRLTKQSREIAVYVYRKKALPRELIDDYFREQSKLMSHDELMDMSRSLTQLGKKLDELNIVMDFPSIPQLGINGGEMSLQRFIYWNFLKCFWNPEQGEKNSTLINYDWYSPSQATRYNEEEFRAWASDLDMKVTHFHSEEACYSARFLK